MTQPLPKVARACRKAVLALALLGSVSTIAACTSDPYPNVRPVANAVNPHPELMGGNAQLGWL